MAKSCWFHDERLLQLRVLRFGFFEDGDVGVGVFPEGEEIFVGGERPDAGSITVQSKRKLWKSCSPTAGPATSVSYRT